MGIFDNDEKMIGTEIRGIPIQSSEKLARFVSDNAVDIAVLTVPNAAVVDVADTLVKSGIRGILNFSYTELDLPKSVFVENVHLSDSLMALAYRIKQIEEQTEE